MYTYPATIPIECWNNVKRRRVYELTTTAIWPMKLNWNDVLSEGCRSEQPGLFTY